MDGRERTSVIERHDDRPAARALELPHATLEVGEIGGRREVLLGPILGSPPAPEPLHHPARFCPG